MIRFPDGNKGKFAAFGIGAATIAAGDHSSGRRDQGRRPRPRSLLPARVSARLE